jgi:putative ABC transport system ATP-binding protein
MITLEQITKSYSTIEVKTLALQNLSLNIEKGEMTAIMGPSGCGKSTLLNIIGLLDKPDSGQYIFEGKEMQNASLKQMAEMRKSNIGFVFQNFNLIDELSVYENIALPLLYQNVSKSQTKERVLGILNRLGIEHRAKHYPSQLSGGQQQRVAIARALVNEPQLILADEPTGNLDSKNGDDVLNLLSQLNESGKTIVMVTHSEKDASLCKRIIRLIDGNIESDSAKIKSTC